MGCVYPQKSNHLGKVLRKKTEENDEIGYRYS
jgi:hypothetical protein